MGLSDSNASFRRKLSKREKKALKKQEKKAALKNENGDVKDSKDGVAEKLYTGESLNLLLDGFKYKYDLLINMTRNGVMSISISGLIIILI